MVPSVSVIIPVHNGGLYLREALESALSQEGVSLEVLILDDASTDGTPAIARDYGNAVTYVALEKQATGIAVTNEGLARARGRYVSILHHDDILLPGKLAAHVRFMDAHPAMALSYSMQRFIGPAGESLGLLRSPVDHRTYHVPGEVELRHLAVQNYINFCNAVVRNSAYAEVGPFQEDLWVSAEWVMWARLAMRFDVGYIHRLLTSYRVHRGGQTLSRTRDTRAYLHQLLRGYDLIWNDPRMPRGWTETRRLSRANIELSMALLHALRREPGGAAQSLARLATGIAPWNLPRLLHSSAFAARVMPRARLLLRR